MRWRDIKSDIDYIDFIMARIKAEVDIVDMEIRRNRRINNNNQNNNILLKRIAVLQHSIEVLERCKENCGKQV